jgi:ABC-type sugar transport system ATPase subunit
VTGEQEWLDAGGLAKHYGGTTALAHADLKLRQGEIRGLVGPNGAGKSTLVKILAGEVSPDEGELRIDGEPVRFRGPADARAAGIVDVPQELTVAPNMSVADNLMLGHYPTRRGLLDERAKRAAVARALGQLGLEVSMDAPVATLQPIEQRLVMVARALARDARLVLFDEPTATASPSEVALVLAAIRMLTKNGVTVLYVSHRLDEVVELCDAVTVVRDGRSVAELPVDAGTRERLVEMMSTAAPDAGSAARPAARARTDETVLDVEDLWGGGSCGVSLSVRGGEIVGVAGLTGSGASNLPLVVCGAMPAEAGSVSIAGAPVRAGDLTGAVRAGLGFIAGDRGLGALRHHSIAQNVSLTTLSRHRRWGMVSRGRELAAVREAASSVALTAAPSVTMATLSGGNQQKAIIARWIAAGARLLLLNDPTAGVDIASRREIHDRLERLAADGVGMLLVSTDLEELATVADRVLVLERGRIKRELAGAELTEGRILDVMTSGAPADGAATGAGPGI